MLWNAKKRMGFSSIPECWLLHSYADWESFPVAVAVEIMKSEQQTKNRSAALVPLRSNKKSFEIFKLPFRTKEKYR